MSALPRWIEPQLLSLAARVPDGAGWIHELKYDGYRLHLWLEDGRVRLLTRGGHDWAERMPALVRCAETLDAGTAYLDGELVVLDENGLPDFDALHGWIRTKRKRVPGYLAFQAFDLLHLDGEDLRAHPLIDRKAALAAMLARSGPAARTVRYVDHLEGNGPVFFERVRAAGLEGVVSKRATSRYRPGIRAAEWVKTKCFERYDLVAVGFTGALGSVLVAAEEPSGRLRYVGRVKGWVARKARAGLVAALSERETDAWPLAGRAPLIKDARWVRPELTVTVTALPREDGEPLRHATLRDWRPRNVLKLVR
ncbi:non-homologous end-joining DNA ligase [Longimicrobium sp.]|uniref:non-homologous end-joining DNA ligase n=1 Tax=Longimicrobium sp. TaxID=2029185 RepID=UPI002E2EED60|nr:non-homologous end-joining DNA ligase [Longimicrobium sp.]HEX6041215.1 non-homologous end-joining DNA ligase [Longimicrobium sp.]